jgi:AraC-like DNA-binding protein
MKRSLQATHYGPASNTARTVQTTGGHWLGCARFSCEGLYVSLNYLGIVNHRERGTLHRKTHHVSQLLYTLAGTGHIISGKATEEASPGHLFVTRPDSELGLEWQTPTGKPWKTVIIHFDMGYDPDRVIQQTGRQAAQSLVPFFQHFFIGKQAAMHLQKRDRALLQASFEHMQARLDLSSSLASAAITGFFAELLAMAANTLRKTTGTNSPDSILQPTTRERQLMRAKNRLQDPASRRTSIEQIAADVGLSKYHFIREFSETFGIPPERYRTGILLQQASKRLAQTDLPVAQIAESCGYSSLSSFSKAFRRFFDMPPQSYREQFSEKPF